MITGGIKVHTSCASTQDECIRIGQPGHCSIARRQNQGRGRLGRSWDDAGGGGIMFTLALPMHQHKDVQANQEGPLERLSIQAGVAVALAAEYLTNPAAKLVQPQNIAKCEIRWPNDVMSDGRKLAGILIETKENTAYLGIGMNVKQIPRQGELAPRTVSLQEMTKEPLARRLGIANILESLAEVRQWDNPTLVAAFNSRNMLLGRTCTFEVGQKRIRGIVESVDPMHGLLVRETNLHSTRCSEVPAPTECKTIFLPARITSLRAVDDELKT